MNLKLISSLEPRGKHAKSQSMLNDEGTLIAVHQQNVKTTPGPPRGVMVPVVLLVHPNPP